MKSWCRGLALSLVLGCGPRQDLQGRGRETWDPGTTLAPHPDAAGGDPGAGGFGPAGGETTGNTATDGGSGVSPDARDPSSEHPDARRPTDSLDGPMGGPDVGSGPGPAATCTLSFTVTTVTFRGEYAPDNVGVIWIADAGDKFVKTLKVWAGKRRKHLDTWNSVSGGNTVDAVTSATAASHAARSASWNCTDVYGQPVPDGIYRVHVQFTESNSGGKLMTPIELTKGSAPVDVTPPDQANFKAIHLQVGP